MKHLAVIAAILALCSASWGLAETTRGNPKRGEDIYATLCLRCHGEKLDGNGPDARDLKMRPADLQSLSSRTKSDWELMIIIAHGVMFTPMHGFRDILDEDEMRDVLSYIRHVAPFKPVA